MAKSEIKTLPFGEKGKKLQVRMGNAVLCHKYEGQFENDALQGLAETGLWYTTLQGQPHAVRGEGETPEAAVEDAIKRNKERIAIHERVVKSLESVSGEKESGEQDGGTAPDAAGKSEEQAGSPGGD